MKRFLPILIGFLLLVSIANAGVIHVIGSGVAGATGIFDDFSGDLSKWTSVYGTFTIEAGKMGTTTKQEYLRNNYTSQAVGSNDQYAKATMTWSGSASAVGLIFRSNASGNCYVVYVYNGTELQWKQLTASGTLGGSINSDTCSLSSGDVLAVQITGADAATECKVWINPDGDPGDPPSEWGDADFTFSDGNNRDINTGSYVGINFWEHTTGTVNADDFYGGAA